LHLKQPLPWRHMSPESLPAMEVFGEIRYLGFWSHNLGNVFSGRNSIFRIALHRSIHVNFGSWFTITKSHKLSTKLVSKTLKIVTILYRFGIMEMCWILEPSKRISFKTLNTCFKDNINLNSLHFNISFISICKMTFRTRK